MFNFNKKKCTAATEGNIIKKRWDGEVWFITVEYTVDGKIYRKKEQMTYIKVHTYKAGKIPVGFKAEPALESIDVGAKVRVFYNPSKPKMSFLPDNNGMHAMF